MITYWLLLSLIGYGMVDEDKANNGEPWELMDFVYIILGSWILVPIAIGKLVYKWMERH